LIFGVEGATASAGSWVVEVEVEEEEGAGVDSANKAPAERRMMPLGRERISTPLTSDWRDCELDADRRRQRGVGVYSCALLDG
jgi:hypothetical protein